MNNHHPPSTDPLPGVAWPPAADPAELGALAALFGPEGPPDLDEIAPPIHWPSLPAPDCRQAWNDLRAWVESLAQRYPHLDHHVIPMCWWRHPGHVEALQALKDHERLSYCDTAPASAAVEWHRAFHDIETRLREWTAQLSCGSRHEQVPTRLRPISEADWEGFIAEDITRRDQAALEVALQAG